MILNFKKLMDEIAYAWDWHQPEENVIEIKPDCVIIARQLVVRPGIMISKETSWELAPGLYEKARAFCELF